MHKVYNQCVTMIPSWILLKIKNFGMQIDLLHKALVEIHFSF